MNLTEKQQDAVLALRWRWNTDTAMSRRLVKMLREALEEVRRPS